MFPVNNGSTRPTTHRRRGGFTLTEMLLAATVMSLMVGAMGMMALGVRTNQTITQTMGSAQQHARVVLNRMRGNITTCTANLSFPGFVVFSEKIGVYTYPDLLVIWKPTGNPLNPDGLPCWNELIIYAYDLNKAQILWEITLPSNTATVPPLTDLTSWQTTLSNARNGIGSQRVQLTDMLRKIKPASSSTQRAAIRFDTRLRPDAVEIDEYLSGTKTWSALRWPQDVFTSDTGWRQNWCRIEVHFRGSDDSIDGALPFITSAAVYYQVKRP